MLSVFLFLVGFTLSVKPVSAFDFPIDPSLNNKFGIHILDESDFTDAAALVNSNGGQWGHVTLVIRKDERDVARWTRAFQQLANLKLIPIIRIATVQESGVWQKPSIDDATSWADFLNALPWPIKSRYVVLFNEPNHAKEWGGSLDPHEYSRIARRYWEEFKKVNPEFFVLPAGFDAAAPNSKDTMNSENYFDKMYETDPFIFTIFDGWTSHSYPNPGFVGSASENGKMTIRGFEWELNYLSNYHLSTKSAVFITETGWINRGRDQEKIANNYAQAFNEAWNDPRVVAVTPFLLRYDAKPFNDFSWKIPGTNQFYPYFTKVLGMEKVSGEPAQ